MSSFDHTTPHPEHRAATTSSSSSVTTSGTNAGLAFVVGALVIVVAVMAWFMFGAGAADDSRDVNINVEGVPGAVEGAVEGVGNAAEAAGSAVNDAAQSVGNAAEEAVDGN
ncbi:hypothetical protein [Ruegeria sp. PrR005]|uniref:Uncharacterized protein n=1 Tax=Ruegeria sp. PrR005 TaxID=2706882 RepID=A0A6B2NYD0_9RHOB|nr:hypothetical protein [Ruegeria sp. PrR005]NDW47697.1 hypothetical protein [Ruegeria sp. PrR005]